tara:strand:- start:16000 stop:17793 length:1794 start_codon:yes stop_codon:yes gene_type:complete
MKILISILLINMTFVFAQESWNTNIFDYSWNKISKRMIYREPIVFTPFEIRAGYFHYGGSDYLNEFPLFGGNINKHPLELDSTHVLSDNFLSNLKDRRGLFFELDIIKTNFLLWILPQNIIDVQFGLGYRMSNMINQPDFPDMMIYSNPENPIYSYKFSPKIHDFNINTTINWQFNELLIPYLYHSIGFSRLSLYKTSDANKNYLYGNGISETLSFGIKKIIQNQEQSKSYNLYYGAEIKGIRTTAINFDDEYEFSPITGFDIRGISFNITFGVALGGNRTIGDEAFSMMLQNDYASAIPAFEEYIEKYPKHGKIKKAKKMLAFCKTQLPYQNYKKGINELNDENLDKAIMRFNDAYLEADENLKLDINFKREELANEILDYVSNNFDKIPMKKCEELLDKALDTSSSVDDDVNILKGKLFFKKATLLHESNLLNDALEYYKITLFYDPDLENLVNYRLKILVNDILDNSNKYQNNKEYLLAIGFLKKAIEIVPELSKSLSLKIKEFENIIDDLDYLKTHETIGYLLEKNQTKGRAKNPLIIGMTKDKIIELIGMPDNIKFLDSSLSKSEVWNYDKLGKKFYIKDEKLYQIENIKEE